MVEIDIDIKGGRATIQKLKVIENKIFQICQEGIFQIASDASEQIKIQAEAQEHIFTGGLIQSIEPMKLNDDTVFVNMRFYGMFVERGTRGSEKPAPPQLVRWVKAKFNQITLSEDYEGDVKKAADAIRRKGTKAHKFIENAMNIYNPEYIIKEIETKMENLK